MSLREAVEHYTDHGGDGQCWQWKGSTTPKGYGTLKVGDRVWRSNRAAWTLAFGDIPRGVVVRHDCDNPGCVNPAHLRLGSHADNVADKVERERCNRGEEHPRAVLNEQLVTDIRHRHRGGESVQSIAVTTGLEYETVRGAIVRRTWKHVP